MFQIFSIENENIAINISCIKQNCECEKTLCSDCKYLKIDAIGVDAVMLLKIISEKSEKENES